MSKEAKVDRGAGMVALTLDHATGAVRIVYDNVTTPELGVLAGILSANAAQLLSEERALGKEVTPPEESQRKRGGDGEGRAVRNARGRRASGAEGGRAHADAVLCAPEAGRRGYRTTAPQGR